MLISNGHMQFVKFIHLMKVMDVDNVIRVLDDVYPNSGGPTVLSLIGREDHLQVQLWYTADNCHLVWMDEECNCCEQQLGDIPLVVGRLMAYLEGMTSELTFTVRG